MYKRGYSFARRKGFEGGVVHEWSTLRGGALRVVEGGVPKGEKGDNKGMVDSSSAFLMHDLMATMGFAVAVAAFVGTIQLQAAPQQNEAVVRSVRGTANYSTDRGSNWKDVKVGTRLKQNSIIRTAPGGTVDPAWKLDGVNLLPYLNGEKSGRPHETLYWRIDGMWAIRHGDWKLVHGLANDEAPELFNLAADVSEKNDLASAQPAKVQELHKLWYAWNAEQASPVNENGKAGKKAKRAAKAAKKAAK